MDYELEFRIKGHEVSVHDDGQSEWSLENKWYVFSDVEGYLTWDGELSSNEKLAASFETEDEAVEHAKRFADVPLMKVGDTVVVIKDCDGSDLVGLHGRVAADDKYDISVDFGEEIQGQELHSCGGLLPGKTGWHFPKGHLKVSSPQLEVGMTAKGASAADIQAAIVALVTGAPQLTAHDVNVERSKETQKIMLPESMTNKEAIVWLQRKEEDDNKKVGINYELDGFPLDIAINFYDALLDIYGFVQKADGFWGTPPTMVGIPVSATEVRRVPWGKIVIPGIGGFLQYQMKMIPDGLGGAKIDGGKLVITGETQQKHLTEIEKVVAKTKERLKTHSIYKGKAVELDLAWMRTGSFDPTGSAPKFTIPLDGADKGKLVFSKQVEKDIQDGLFTALEHPDFCADSEIPTKRGVLLVGEYGTGKTMTAWVAAKMAVANGMGFIFLKDIQDLAACFEFARLYQEPNGVVVFAEDIDKAVSADPHAINRLQNAFDGVNTKRDKIITILTTNFVDKVPQSLLRSGRIDLLVKVERPDAEAAIRLVQQYGRDLLSPDIDYEKVGEVLKGHLPAEIREAVERSKMSCISRVCRENPNITRATFSIKGKVQEDDIVQSVHQMKVQHELLKPKEVDRRSDLEKAAQIRANADLQAAEMYCQNSRPELEDSFNRN